MNERECLNKLNASRKADREAIAKALEDIAAKHGAAIERRDDGPNPDYHGHSIVLRFVVEGVGAMVDIDNLHGGAHSLLHWYNEKYPARNFTARFCVNVGDSVRVRPHHKATSCPSDWFSLAMYLDAGLCLAARGQAFVPSTE